MSKNSILIALLFMAGVPLLFGKANPDDDLAHVLILRFQDNTHSKNFGYMPGSIYEGLNVSMKKRFEYKEVKLKKSLAKLVPQTGKMKEQVVRKLAQQSDSDFIIFGNFDFNKKENKLIIHTFIYLRYDDKFVKVADTKNPVDTTIFLAVDKVSAKLVAEIQKIAEAQEKERSAASKTAGGVNVIAAKDKSLGPEVERLKLEMARRYEGRFVTYEEFQKEKGKQPSELKGETDKQRLYKQGVSSIFLLKSQGDEIVVRVERSSKGEPVSSKEVRYKKGARDISKELKQLSETAGLKEKKKLTLRKERSIRWKDKSWEATLGIGSGGFSPAGSESSAGALFLLGLSRHFSPNWYWGGELTFTGYTFTRVQNNRTDWKVSVTGATATAFYGYRWAFHPRLALSFDLGLGGAYFNLAHSINSSEFYTKKYTMATVRGQVGFQWLAFPSASLGLLIRSQAFMDQSNDPLTFAGGALYGSYYF